MEELEEIGAIAQRSVEDGTLSGIVVLVDHDGATETMTAGTLGEGRPGVEADSLYRIASMSKQMAAAVALTLVRDALVDLDEPVDRLLPELADRRVLARPDAPLDETVPAARPMTVRDLLAFTCGFGMAVEMFSAPEPWPVVAAVTELALGTLGPPRPHEQPTPEEWLARFATLPLIAQPGERWLYNTGASILGLLVSRAAGSSIADTFARRLFEPLGMDETAFFTTETDRLATAYRHGASGRETWDEPEGQWSHPPVFADAAAGLVSKAGDVAAFARMLLAEGGDLLPRELVAEMMRNQLTEGQREGATAFLGGAGWGLGGAVEVDGPRAGAYGWTGGLGTSFLVDPRRDLAVVILTQRLFDTAALPPWHAAIQEAAYRAIGS